MPGTASGQSEPAHDGKPALEPNVDGGSIIANNIISDFGYGDSEWIWGGSGSCSPIRFDSGQTPNDPPLRDVLIQGNIIYDSGRDEPLVNGVPTKQEPRYDYAVRIKAGSPTSPQGLHFSGNIFHPGAKGVSNVELAAVGVMRAETASLRAARDRFGPGMSVQEVTEPVPAGKRTAPCFHRLSRRRSRLCASLDRPQCCGILGTTRSRPKRIVFRLPRRRCRFSPSHLRNKRGAFRDRRRSGPLGAGYPSMK